MVQYLWLNRKAPTATARVALYQRGLGSFSVLIKTSSMADEITVSAPNERVDLEALKRPGLGRKEQGPPRRGGCMTQKLDEQSVG